MEIHKPKAAHSLREFLVELGTITCGVIIALSLEQFVTTIEWSRKVAESREALALELAENLGKAESRIQLARCIDQRLDALGSIVDQAAKSGALPPVATPTVPNTYSWGKGVWNSVLSSQVGAHLPAKKLRDYGRFYQVLDRIAEAEPREEDAWTELFGLAGPGRPFDSEDARTYRRAIGKARQLNGLISAYGVRLKQAADDNHIAYDTRTYEGRVRPLRSLHPDCGPPHGAPPTAYGAAPYADFVDWALRHPAY
jgi:hypothetical protein